MYSGCLCKSDFPHHRTSEFFTKVTLDEAGGEVQLQEQAAQGQLGWLGLQATHSCCSYVGAVQQPAVSRNE
jgi:hypothetical protein